MNSQHVLNKINQGGKDIAGELLAINDLECQLKSQELLKAFKKNLEMLRDDYLPLTEAEFHAETTKAVEQTKQRLKTVGPLKMDGESRDVLLNDHEANLQTLKRGVQITKIFVADRQDLLNRSLQKALYQYHRNGIDIRILYAEDSRLVSNEIHDYTLDFAIYNDAVITDRNSDNSGYFARKTTNPAEIKKYLRRFDVIKAHAHRFTSDAVQSQLQLIDILPI